MKRTTFATVADALAALWLRANTFTVVKTNDSGAGSLRQAILDANANGGLDTIAQSRNPRTDGGVRGQNVRPAMTFTPHLDDLY